MTALLDRHPDTAHPVLAGVAELHHLLDQLHTHAGTSLRSADHAALVADLDRAGRRLEALKLKILAAADHAGTARDAGFTGTDAWTARHTNTSRTTAAREVHLATELEHGHDTTAQALDAGLVSPAHAAVILHAADQLPAGVSDQQRATVESVLVEQAQRLNPDQLRRLARRASRGRSNPTKQPSTPTRTTSSAPRKPPPATPAASPSTTTTTAPPPATSPSRPWLQRCCARSIESMTAPRRMRASEQPSHDWRHRRGLAFAELLEHLPTRAQPEAEPRRRKRTGGAQRGMFGLRHLGDHHTPTATAQPDPARELSQRESSAAERAVHLHTLSEPRRVGSPTRPKPYILRCAPPVRL